VSVGKRLAKLESRLAQLERENAGLRATLIERDARVAELEAELAGLRGEAGKNSRNSSKPPSSDSPDQRKDRSKPPGSGRKRGGQPGHEGSQRALLPPEKVTRTRPHFPARCANASCGAKLPRTPEGEPLRQQTIEVPKIVADVTEDQWHSVRCPCCEHVTQARPRGRQRGMCGTNLIAIITLLVGAYHLSRRKATTCVGDILGIDLSLGLVSKLEGRVGNWLKPAHEEASRSVLSARVKNLDATGWSCASAARTLWVIACETAVVFHIVSDASRAKLQPLLGTLKGILISDRGSQFGFWASVRRQICWAHLLRKFVSFAEHPDARVQGVGRGLVLCTEAMFHEWHRIRDGTNTRVGFQAFIENLRPVVEGHLEGLVALGVPSVSGSCTNILAHRAALWTFAHTAGVEPTNNHAERLLRAFVHWRDKTFGSRSERGDRFAERVMTVVETCRKRDRHVLSFLRDTIDASLCGKPLPSLIHA
jgi:transposase